MFWQWWPFNVDIWNMVDHVPWPCFNHGLNMVRPPPCSPRCFTWGSPTSSQPEVLRPEVHPPPPKPMCFTLPSAHLLPAQGALLWGPPTSLQPKMLCLRFTNLLPAWGPSPRGSPTSSQTYVLHPYVSPPPPSPRCFIVRFTLLPAAVVSPWGSLTSS